MRPKVPFTNASKKRKRSPTKQKKASSSSSTPFIPATDDPRDSGSESSTTTDWKQKQRRKHARHKKNERVPQPVPPPEPVAAIPMDDNKEAQDIFNEITQVAEFDALFVKYPFLANTTGEESKNAHRTQADFARAMAVEREDPLTTRIFRQHMARLPRPEFVSEVFDSAHVANSAEQQTHTIALIKSRQRFLPIMSSMYESLLLRESGNYQVKLPTGETRIIRFPPCKFVTECYAYTNWRTIQGLEKPIVLCGILLPHELQQKRKFDVQTHGARPCVLCYRFACENQVLWERFRRSSQQVTVDPAFFWQLYRNPYDVPGGYFSEYMIFPNSNQHEQFVDPIVSLRPNLLRATFDTLNRCVVIDQSAMVWKPRSASVAVGEPLVGEPLRDFQRRSRAHGDVSTPRDILRMDCLDPRKALLRRYPQGCVATHYHVDSGWAARNQLHGYSDRLVVKLLDEVTHRYRRAPSFDLAAAWDTLFLCRWGSNGSGRVFAVYEDTLTEDTAPDVTHKIWNCSFWHNPRPSRDPVVHMFSKVLPQRCAKRKFAPIFAKFSSADPKFGPLFVQWFVVAMLGNHRMTPDHERPPVLIRAFLYFLYYRDPGAILEYLVAHPDTLMWVTRHYLVSAMRNQPTFVRHAAAAFDWDAFVNLTRETMRQLRHCVVRDIVVGTVWRTWFLHPDFLALLRRYHAHRDWIKEARRMRLDPQADEDDICRRAHDGVLALAYHRGRNSLLLDFHILRPKELVGLMQQVLSAEEKETIWMWILSVPITSAEDALERMMRLFKTDEAVPDFKQMLHLYDNCMAGRKMIKTSIHLFASKHQYAYHLIREFCVLWKVRESMQWYSLPLHYVHYQSMAVRESFKLPPDSPVPRKETSLWFCWVCRNTCSVVIRFAKACRKHKDPLCRQCNKWYKYGYDDVITDYTTGDLYCSKHHEAKPPTTDAVILPDEAHTRYNTRLASIMLLGRMVLFDGSLYTLCPQQGCGRVMVFDPEQCVYTDRGFACAACTSAIRQGREEKQPSMWTCVICDKQFPTASLFCYPGGCFLCPRHHGPHLVQAVTEWRMARSPSKTEITREEVIPVILAAIETRRIEWKLLHKDRDRRLLASRRSQTRSNKRQ
jgi:hypothetical protein